MKQLSSFDCCRTLTEHAHSDRINLIHSVLEADAIYILGTDSCQLTRQSFCATNEYKKTYIDHLFVLVLIPQLYDSSLIAWQERIEQKCNDLGFTTAIVLETETFKYWLSVGHLFAQNVVQSISPIYNVAHFSISLSIHSDTIVSEKISETTYKDGLNKTQEFYAGAELFLIRKQHKLCLFMLHQATEQALSTLVKIGMGYYCCSHNIERLLRYASWVSYAVVEIFPNKSEEDKKRFKLMQRAYIDSRYKADFSVDYRDLIILIEKVNDLIKLLKGLRAA